MVYALEKMCKIDAKNIIKMCKIDVEKPGKMCFELFDSLIDEFESIMK